MVKRFRLHQVPAQLRSAGIASLANLYNAAVQTGLRLYNSRPEPALAEELLGLASSAHAFSLRGAHAGYSKGFEHAYARAFESPSSPEIRRMRLTRIEQDTEEAALEDSPGDLEPDWRSRLAPDEAAIVIHAGEPESAVWTATRESIDLCAIPHRSELARATSEFRAAVESSSSSAAVAGRALHQMLFGCLGPEVHRKPRWLIVASDVLFRAPLAALVSGGTADQPRYLVEQHSIRLMPGLWMLGKASNTWTGPMLAAGDAVYNRADPRAPGWSKWPNVIELPRLPASRQELLRCSRTQPVPALIRAGMESSAPDLETGLRSTKPAVLHLAAHVTPSPGTPEESLLVLSPSKDGVPGLLGTEWITSQRAAPELVVMSGCRSGSGEVRPGDGLMGLTRAWIAGGAAGVVATHWPVPDDQGVFWESFYRHRAEPGTAVDQALRMAQIEALKSGTFRAKAANWAAYFLVSSR
ncbi:MAG: CHAT domain-containing protein [Acidobacteria bacterium]|nr:CHAT domain-containing protein [Acidobacteriota bacterium]